LRVGEFEDVLRMGRSATAFLLKSERSAAICCSTNMKLGALTLSMFK
jgi:hypothetical protein